jgi:hypothetical protein
MAAFLGSVKLALATWEPVATPMVLIGLESWFYSASIVWR